MAVRSSLYSSVRSLEGLNMQLDLLSSHTHLAAS
jgi:hypothetical protein